MESAFGKALGAAALASALGVAAAAPLGAQQVPPGTAPTAEQGTKAGAQVPEATVQRTGAAIRDLSGIQARFTQRMQNARPSEHQAIAEEAHGAAEAALAAQGLTLEEYNSVIRLAQADQSLRERLISAARGAR